MTEAPQPGGTGDLDLNQLVETVESHLLGDARTYTRDEVAQLAGVPIDDAQSMWRALGFAALENDQRTFSTADVTALKNVTKLQVVSAIPDDVMHAMTRIIGQTFARLASWQGQMTMDIVGEHPELLSDGGAGLLTLMDELTPVIADLHDYVWRRQMTAFFARVVANMSAESGPERRMAVGFADMADFTAFTRRSSEVELRAVLESFETLATDIVGAHSGQIVKTIGDEILFVADDAGDAAEIALRLIEAAEVDEGLPPMRAGVAFGPVVNRLGDVYGQTVNIASRLTSVARTGTVLIDTGEAEALADDDRFSLSSMRSVSVRGYHHLRPARLRHAAR